MVKKYRPMETSLIIKNVSKHISLNPSEIKYFTSLLEHQKFDRKEFLVKKGEVASHTNFITHGCLRNYHMDEEGVIHITQFAIEDWWISDLASFLTQEPSECFVDAIEETEVLRLSRTNYERLFEKVPKFERFFRIIHQNAFIAQNRRILDSISLKAEARYNAFLQRYPAMNQRIPQKQIASYLGVTPEFLSILRSKKVTKS